jgi:plasmid stabilization system protein ParE
MKGRKSQSERISVEQYNKDIDEAIEQAGNGEFTTLSRELADHPERYSQDKYRIKNDSSYRAFEIYKYRVSYHISPDQFTIVRVLHTKREPKAY